MKFVSLALVTGVAACSGGNPFDATATTTDTTTTTTTTTTDTTTTGTGVERAGIPPGTVAASPNLSLFRLEPTTTGTGSGSVTSVKLNADDTFTVDNIPFDGDRPYDRGTAVSSLSPKADGIGRFQVYEAPATSIDALNDRLINQLGYRAVYGESRNTVTGANGTVLPTTQFAIVRTGSYTEYGFGGFVYQRNTSVTLPETLQAQYVGHSAGLRDSSTGGGLHYTTADVTVDIDHEDFNDSGNVKGDGVKGSISNRKVIDLNGNDVTSEIAGILEAGTTTIPDVSFVISADVLDTNGEIVTDIFTTDTSGSKLEEGKFYAIVSGTNPDEVIGVYVLESTNSRDTSGFIVYRDDPA